jgi:site-specific DNA-methyltransferase (adenine-specific)
MNDAEAIDEAARQYIPGSPEAAEFDGWGTALKPAFEPIVLARKPLSEKNVAANVLKWGTGGLNVGACRVGLVEGEAPYSYPNGAGGSDPNHMWRGRGKGDGQIAQFGNVAGRWPANITHDGSEDVEAAFPSYNAGGGNGKRKGNGYGGGYGAVAPGNGLKDKGSAARFFYSSKAGRDDRGDSDHPTIKPISLKQWLAKLITPKGGRVLDPFAGSGTTGEACAREHFKAVLIEQDKGYCEHIRQRMMRYRPWHSGQRIMPRKRDAAEYGFAMVYEE